MIPTELDAVAELLYWQYTRPQLLRWDELPENVQDYWRADANMVLTFVDQFRLVRSRHAHPGEPVPAEKVLHLASQLEQDADTGEYRGGSYAASVLKDVARRIRLLAGSQR